MVLRFLTHLSLGAASLSVLVTQNIIRYMEELNGLLMRVSRPEGSILRNGWVKSVRVLHFDSSCHIAFRCGYAHSSSQNFEECRFSHTLANTVCYQCFVLCQSDRWF